MSFCSFCREAGGSSRISMPNGCLSSSRISSGRKYAFTGSPDFQGVASGCDEVEKFRDLRLFNVEDDYESAPVIGEFGGSAIRAESCRGIHSHAAVLACEESRALATHYLAPFAASGAAFVGFSFSFAFSGSEALAISSSIHWSFPKKG